MTATAAMLTSARVPGFLYEAMVNLTGDSSYPAGGYPFGLTQIQGINGGAYSAIDSIEIANNWFSATPSSYIAVYDKTNGKVLAMAQGTAGAAVAQVDVTATTDLSTFTCTLRVRLR